jgi:ABC-type proline/glycine betaine transport system permease subunit
VSPHSPLVLCCLNAKSNSSLAIKESKKAAISILGSNQSHIVKMFSSHLDNPIEIIQTYKGGMSFHGGVLGCIVTAWLFTKKYSISLFLFFYFVFSTYL